MKWFKSAWFFVALLAASTGSAAELSERTIIDMLEHLDQAIAAKDAAKVGSFLSNDISIALI